MVGVSHVKFHGSCTRKNDVGVLTWRCYSLADQKPGSKDKISKAVH